MKKVIDAIGGRKMLIYLIGFIVGITIALVSNLTDEVSDFIIMMTAVAVGGNSAEHISEAIKERISKK